MRVYYNLLAYIALSPICCITFFNFYCADTIMDCWVHLINNGITIRGNSVTVEWQGTGAGESTTFTCQLDNRPAETCECWQTTK